MFCSWDFYRRFLRNVPLIFLKFGEVVFTQKVQQLHVTITTFWSFLFQSKTKNTSLLNCVPYVLTCQRALRAYVPRCQRALRAHVLTCFACLRGYVLTCLACLHAHVPTCLRAHVPCVLKCSNANVLMCLSTNVPRVPCLTCEHSLPD